MKFVCFRVRGLYDYISFLRTEDSQAPAGMDYGGGCAGYRDCAKCKGSIAHKNLHNSTRVLFGPPLRKTTFAHAVICHPAMANPHRTVVFLLVYLCSVIIQVLAADPTHSVSSFPNLPSRLFFFDDTEVNSERPRPFHP